MPENPDLAREFTGLPTAVLSVSALLRSVRDLLEHRYPLLWVSGEISNFVVARSGHAYFVLKDAQAQVRCVMFRQRNQLLDWRPQDGMQVEARALITLYEARGDFQLTIDTMRRAGAGALYERFQRLRDRLAAEGLFAEEVKRELPAYPRRIGVVTSLGAAALRDILSTLARRNPGIPVTICPAPVQGAGAAERIAAALGALGSRGACDVIILARGGGGIEDLWAFNEEVVAHAIRACPVPVVTGVGHETDFTIADFAADQRAPTPTAAAELVSPDRHALLQSIRALAHRLSHSAARSMEGRMQRLDLLGGRLQHPGRRLEAQAAHLKHLRQRLIRAMDARLDNCRWRLSAAWHSSRAIAPRPQRHFAQLQSLLRRLHLVLQAQLSVRDSRVAAFSTFLAHLDPDRVLQRGYSVVRDAQGRLVTNVSHLATGDVLDITLAKGTATVRVERTR